MKPLPFNFETLSENICFVSNLSGFHEFLTTQQLHELVHFGSTNDVEVNRQLEAKLFTSSDENQDIAVLALASGMSKKLVAELRFNPIYMVVPTLRCDHTCTYCQVSRAPEGAVGYDLDEDKIDAIIDMISKASAPPYKIEIQGGEPLLRFDLVRKLYETACRKLGNDVFEFVVATSLSLLSDEVLQWAAPSNIFFSTSIDGSEKVHNANRILPHDSSHALLKKSLNNIIDKYGTSKVGTVTTVTHEMLDNPKDIISAHIDLGLTDLFVRPLSNYGFAKNERTKFYTASEFISFYESLFDALLEFRKSGFKCTEHYGAIHLKRVFKPGFSQYADLKSPSGVFLNSWIFNYDGRIYGSDEFRMLQRTIPDVDFSIGSIDESTLNSDGLYQNVLANSFNVVTPGCSTCAYQPYCGSDPCAEISLQGEPVGDKALSTFCSVHKAMFSFLMRRWATCSESRIMMMEWIDD